MAYKPKRSKIKSSKSKKMFSKTAKKVHPRNFPSISRGGIRM